MCYKSTVSCHVVWSWEVWRSYKLKGDSAMSQCSRLSKEHCCCLLSDMLLQMQSCQRWWIAVPEICESGWDIMFNICLVKKVSSFVTGDSVQQGLGMPDLCIPMFDRWWPFCCKYYQWFLSNRRVTEQVMCIACSKHYNSVQKQGMRIVKTAAFLSMKTMSYDASTWYTP